MSSGTLERALPNRGEERLRGRAALFVWLVAALSIAAAASTGLFFPPTPEAPYIATVLYLAVATSFACIGAIVATRRRRNILGWAMWVGGAVVAVEWSGFVYADVSIRTHGGSLPATVPLAWVSTWMFYPMVGLILVAVPLLFPDGRLPSARWRPIAIVASLSIAIASLVDAFSAGQLASLPVENPVGIAAVASAQPVLSAIARTAFLVVLPIAAIGSPIVRFARGGPVERAQLKWFASAAGVTGIAGVLSAVAYSEGVTEGVTPVVAVVQFLGMAALPVSIGIAIFHDRLYEIDDLVSRSAVYGLLTVGVLGLYVVIVGGLSVLFGSSGDPLIAILATAVVAVLFEPARVRVQRAVNNVLFGDRDDPYVALSRFGQRLEATLSPAEVLPAVASIVREALRLPYVAIALGIEGASTVAAASGEPVPDPVSIPLIHNGERIGELRLGRRTGDEAFSSADRRLLEDFARQVALAAHAVGMTAELQIARQRLVTTREEERRRLRRELHDELGTHLAGISVQMGRLRNLIAADAAAADKLAVELRDEVRTAIAGVRRILLDLRPTALDQLGLPAALQEIAGQAARSGLHVTVELPEELDSLPAAVDVAAYRIIQEAIANVERHARASRCDLHVWLDDGLHLVVRDDGIGVSDRPPSRSGVGLNAMRERAAELGGTCLVTRGPRGGTIVSVRLPVPG